MKRALVGWILLMTLVHVSLAQKPAIVTDTGPGWKKIGETNAGFRKETESITVMVADRFSAVKLKVTDASLNIDRLLVFYESGELQEIEMNNDLRAGEETEVFDISAGSDIQKISFHYKTLPNQEGEKAHVELYGLKPNTPSDSYRNDDRDREDDDVNQATEDLADGLEKAAENVEEDIEDAKEKIDPETDDTGRKPKSAAEEAVDNMSEDAANAAAGVNDQLFVGKAGPEGQNIYIDKDDKCYYINDEGKKTYIDKSKLKERPRKD